MDMGIVLRVKLNWEYDEGYFDISMSNYVQKQLTNYVHPSPKCKQHHTICPAHVVFGKTAQDLPPPNMSALLDKKGKLLEVSCTMEVLLM